MEDHNNGQNSVPDKKAVALRYREKEGKAPKIVAKGRGYTAESILQAAQRSAVPVYQDKTLVSMLMALELDREIPPELYAVVAEILAYVYRLDKRKKPDIKL
ncbi:EscU/YscU/HrcU family type III secretion system export apparatus switch protein [Pectinatus cerevisiiphilus]|uniref:Flagellar biosynthesis protein n=1 Tax=Pectinatus cerevisiiphilus TaxID=86956 RepID=A0A4R3K932_9FIRM|nr:EscU/YscU/HrcU family type III secretion system export apparatus switch protein [Pectinatus cerevisiiphilus]TCS79353.1 flagellar biosynthesis protein [Pectinatus cerevisiiphilus]